MTENTLNQNTKYVDELIDAVEPDFNFSDNREKHDFIIFSDRCFRLVIYGKDCKSTGPRAQTSGLCLSCTKYGSQQYENFIQTYHSECTKFSHCLFNSFNTSVYAIRSFSEFFGSGRSTT